MTSTTDTSGSVTSTNGDNVTLNDSVACTDLWFYPGEELETDALRVTLMGTGWGTVIRQNQKGASIFVELGCGKSFVFDVGPGSGINYNTMQVPFSRMENIFLTHLHMDHCSDLSWVYTFGPATDRFRPLHIYGPHNFYAAENLKGDPLTRIPDMDEFVKGLKHFSHWHNISFEACLNVADGYQIVTHKLDYRKNTGEAYRYDDEDNEIIIRHWPALHIVDGAISYSLEWTLKKQNKTMKFVWSGDTQPNQYMVENGQDADLLIHETAPSVTRLATAQNLTQSDATNIVKQSHTPAYALGKVLSLTNPKLAVTCHSPIDPEEWEDYIKGVNYWWPNGTYQVGEDLMVFKLKPGQQPTVRKAGIHERTWGIAVEKNPNLTASSDGTVSTTLPIDNYRTDMFNNTMADTEWQPQNQGGAWVPQAEVQADLKGAVEERINEDTLENMKRELEITKQRLDQTEKELEISRKS